MRQKRNDILDHAVKIAVAFKDESDLLDVYLNGFKYASFDWILSFDSFDVDVLEQLKTANVIWHTKLGTYEIGMPNAVYKCVETYFAHGKYADMELSDYIKRVLNEDASS